MNDLWYNNKMLDEDKPVLIFEEVIKSKIDKKSKIKLDIKGSKLFPKCLSVLNISHMVTSPYQKEHLHIKNDEED
jgi:hypothetical protein